MTTTTTINSSCFLDGADACRRPPRFFSYPHSISLARSVLKHSITQRSWPAADIQRDERVELSGFEHHVDVDLFVARADASAARANLDRGDS
jgi:hypothetical protein